jgi:hypothetical protein
MCHGSSLKISPVRSNLTSIVAAVTAPHRILVDFVVAFTEAPAAAIFGRKLAWNGPEVTRIYSSNDEIERIQPDSKGFPTVTYKVRLTYREQGSAIRTENFTAQDLEPRHKKSP